MLLCINEKESRNNIETRQVNAIFKIAVKSGFETEFLKHCTTVLCRKGLQYYRLKLKTVNLLIKFDKYVPTPHLNNNNNIGCGTQHMLEGCPGEIQLKSNIAHLIPGKRLRCPYDALKMDQRP